VTEATERGEDDERLRDGDVEEFRERLFEDYGPEELEPPEWSEEKEEGGPDHPVDKQPPEAEEGSAGREGLPAEEPTGRDEPAKGAPEVTQTEPADEPSKEQQSRDEPAERPDSERTASEVPDADKAEAVVELPRSEEVPEDAPVKIESFSPNDDQIVVTEHEGPEGPKAPPAPEVETWDFHHLPSGAQAEGGDEVRTFEAVDYGKGDVVRIPKTDLEREGFEPEPGENAIVKLGLRNVESEEVEAAFARYNGSDRRAEVYVGDIGGEKGSRYELVEASRYDEDRFVRDFERGKCEHMENVRLEHADEKLFLNVDERRVELEDYRLSTSGSHAVLRGKLDEEDSCKIEFDGRRAAVKFGRDYPVEGMRMEGDELVIRYAQSRDVKHEHRMYLEHLENPERPSLSMFDRPEMLEHVKMFDHPERVGGLYQFVLDKEGRDETRNLLEEAEKRGDYKYCMMKAEISERLVPNLLELVGWERIERHPFSEHTKEGASANGTDWLMRTPDGKLVMMEIKWYENSEDAVRKGESQAARSFDRRRPYGGSEIEAAYIANVYWKVNDEPIKIYVKRVRPQEELL